MINPPPFRVAAALIGSGAGDCAPAPSHTTGRTVFSIRRLESPEVRWIEEQTPSSISISCRSFLFRFPPSAGLELHPSGFTGSTLRPSGPAPGVLPPDPVLGVLDAPLDESSIRSVRLLRSFAPPALPGFFATMTSADFSKALTLETSPSKVLPLSPRAARLYLLRLDGLRVSLFLASSPPAPGLTAGSCPCGRGFACRFLQLHLAATPCGSAKVGSITSFRISHPLETAHVGHTRGNPCGCPSLGTGNGNGGFSRIFIGALRAPLRYGRSMAPAPQTPPGESSTSRRRVRSSTRSRSTSTPIPGSCQGTVT